MWRCVEESNNVFFMFEVADIEKARAFINDPTAAEAGKAAGVVDGECHFAESVAGYWRAKVGKMLGRGVASLADGNHRKE
jgi:hypothetical protein